MKILPTITVEPATEPLSLTEAKLYLRVDTSDDDDLITQQIAAARKHVEHVTWRSLITQTHRLDLRSWPTSGRFVLPRPPTISVTSIYYINSGGSSVEWDSANYTVDLSEPATIEPAYNVEFPQLRTEEINAVQVTYQAGYGAASDVPDAIKAAMYLLIGDMYENRLTEARPQVNTADALLAPFKIR